MATIQKITPNLWFDNVAEEAVNYYVSIFKNSSIGRKSFYTKEGFEFHQKPAGTPMTIEFQIEGQEFVALNAGPEFQFTEAVSFIVSCESQEEIDYYWNKLSAGGPVESQQCGWLKDKFGVSWQIIPTILTEIMSGNDSEQMSKTMNAMFQMKKLDIKKLKNG